MPPLRLRARRIAIGWRSRRKGESKVAYQITTVDPSWIFDVGEFERQGATFLKAQGITTDAGRAALVAGITAGSALELAIVKALANCLKVQP